MVTVKNGQNVTTIISNCLRIYPVNGMKNLCFLLTYFSLRMSFTALHVPSVSKVISEAQLGTYTTEPRNISQNPHRQCINTLLTTTIRRINISASSKVTIAVIAKERDPVNLRLKEAFYIRKQKPDINSREERSELTELLF